jgi:hypothetical protein
MDQDRITFEEARRAFMLALPETLNAPEKGPRALKPPRRERIDHTAAPRWRYLPKKATWRSRAERPPQASHVSSIFHTIRFAFTDDSYSLGKAVFPLPSALHSRILQCVFSHILIVLLLKRL